MSFLGVAYYPVWYNQRTDVYELWDATFDEHMSDLEQFFTAHVSGRGPAKFISFSPDLDPRNIVVDPDTGIITCLVDFEYTNAMPAQFAHDPPPWLFLILPEQCLDRGFFPWFLQRYTPLLDESLEAMRRAEKEAAGNGISAGDTPLSTHMLESFASGRVGFNYAASFSEHVDSFYWEMLYKHHLGGAALVLPSGLEADLEKYLQHTEEQIKMYKRAWDEYPQKVKR